MAGLRSIHDQVFGIGEETVYGTAVAVDRLLEISSEGFESEYDVVHQDIYHRGQETTQSDRTRTVRMGSRGSIEMPLFMGGLGILFRSAFPTVTSGHTAWSKDTTTGSPLYSGHYCTDSHGQRKSYTGYLERVDYEGDLVTQHYTGLACTSFDMTVSQGEAVMIGFDYVGVGDALTGPDNSSATYRTAAPFYHFDDVAITTGAADSVAPNSKILTARGFNVSADFGLNTDIRYLVGTSARRQPLRTTIPSYTGSIDIDVSNTQMFEKWTQGEGLSLQCRMSNKFTHNSKEFTRFFELTIPNLIFTNANISSSLDSLTSQSLDFRARDGSNNAMILEYATIDTSE